MRNGIERSIALALAAALTGCDGGNGVTGGSADATVDVTIRGDSPSGATASRAGEGSADAQVDVTARVWVQAESGRWVEVTRGAASQTVDAAGAGGAKLLASARMAGGRYRRVRVDFERVEARSESGIRLGVGVLTGSLKVDVGSDGASRVERAVLVEARSEGRARLEIDLNSDEWMHRADSRTKAVAESEFEAAVRVAEAR